MSTQTMRFEFGKTVYEIDSPTYEANAVLDQNLRTCQIHADHTATLTLPGGTDASLYYAVGEYYYAVSPNAGTTPPTTYDEGGSIPYPVLGRCSNIAANVVTFDDVPINWPVATSSNFLIGHHKVNYVTLPSFTGVGDNVQNMPKSIKIFSYYPPEYTADPTNHGLNIQILPGSVWESTSDPVNGINRKFFFMKGGYLDASLHGAGRQAVWKEITVPGSIARVADDAAISGNAFDMVWVTASAGNGGEKTLYTWDGTAYQRVITQP
jgi:hypothetical protein